MLSFKGNINISSSPYKIFEFFRSDLKNLPSFCPEPRDLLGIEEIDRLVIHNEDGTEYETTTSRWIAVLRKGESSALIRWVEHENFISGVNGIYHIPFSLVDSESSDDSFFSAFQGTWEIRPIDEESKITLLLECELLNDSFEEDFGDFIGSLVAENLRGILMGLSSVFGGNHNKPSIEYERCRAKQVSDFGKSDDFVFLLGHASDEEHLTEILWRKSGGPEGLTSRDKARKFRDLSRLFPTHISETFSDRDGINLALVSCPFVPGLDTLGFMRERTREAFDLASKIKHQRSGNCMISLGGFTSIISSQKVLDEFAGKGIYSTTGSFFTSGSILYSIIEAANILGKNLSNCTAAILGAGGSIGGKIAALLSKRVREVRLTGRNESKIANLVSRYKLKNASIFSEKDNKIAVKGSDFVITVTSSAEPVISGSDCDPGTVICDAGFPKNVRTSDRKDQVFRYPGGLAITPWPLEFDMFTDLPINHYENKVIYGCWAEGIILGLEALKDQAALSFESEGIREIELSGLEAVEKWTEKIMHLGKKHGLLPAPIGRFLKSSVEMQR